MAIEFFTGDWVRIKPDAFPNTDDKMDMVARGLVGQLHERLDFDMWTGIGLWYWQTGNGYVHTSVLESEIELVKRSM